MQLDQRRAQLVQQKEDLEASLASQRNVSAQLRDEVAKLTAKLQQVRRVLLIVCVCGLSSHWSPSSFVHAIL